MSSLEIIQGLLCLVRRIVGADVSNGKRNFLGQNFTDAMYASFNQEYQGFNLLTQFSQPTQTQLALIQNVTLADPAPVLALADTSQEKYSPLVTAAFDAHNQYDSVDITVTAIAGSDLAAVLPTSWLPMSKNTPAFETAMRQRGFTVSTGCSVGDLCHYITCNFLSSGAVNCVYDSMLNSGHLHCR